MKLSKDSVEVIAFDSTNISDLVQSITLYESIDGYLQGSIQILDGINCHFLYFHFLFNCLAFNNYSYLFFHNY